jgi:anaerobic selenocysteine-containing dehydrogenase
MLLSGASTNSLGAKSRSAYNIVVSSAVANSPATRVVHAVCTHDCPDSCGVLVTVDSLTGRATKVQGDPAHPVTRGFLCGKVARYLDRVYSPERLLYPMRRRAGVAKGPLPQGREAEAFERISWDEALDAIAARLAKTAAEHGPESILPYSYAGTIGQLGFGSMDRDFFTASAHRSSTAPSAPAPAARRSRASTASSSAPRRRTSRTPD